jgi:hypothetical protein
MIVRSHDYRRRRYVYRCAYHHQRGRAVCGNALEAPMVTKEREQRRAQLEVRLLAVNAGERVWLADEVRSRLDAWRALLRRQPEEGRVVLDAFLTRRIRWTPLPDEGCYEF